MKTQNIVQVPLFPHLYHLALEVTRGVFLQSYDINGGNKISLPSYANGSGVDVGTMQRTF